MEYTTRGGRAFAIRFRAYGKRRYLTLDVVTRSEAEAELANVLADVRRGIWRPPRAEPEVVEPRPEPTLHEFATEWFEEKRRELRPTTEAAYMWELTDLLLPFFARHRLSEITVAEVDRYRRTKVREGDDRRRAIDAGDPLRDVDGRVLRPLSATSINKAIARLAAILEEAVDQELIDRNPASGRRRRLKVATPARTYLDRPDQIAALLDAAAELDVEAKRGQRARRAILSTLVFAGLRIGELLALSWGDVALGAGRLRVADSKTDAGVREIDLLPTLRDTLAEHKAGSRFADPGELVFPTSKGRPDNRNNVRRRVLLPAIERASVRLAEDGGDALPTGLTPHSMRRTFASLLYGLGESPPYVMDQLGHTDPKLALKLYARAMRRGDEEGARLDALVGTPQPRPQARERVEGPRMTDREQQEWIASKLDVPAAAEEPMTDFDDAIPDDLTVPPIAPDEDEDPAATGSASGGSSPE